MLFTFKSRYPIAKTMAFGREYHPNLRYTLREKRALLRSAIVIWMFVDGKLVGETYGIPLAEMDPQQRHDGCPANTKAVYCYSNTILGKYKRKGYGTILKAAFLGRVSAEFSVVYGHARPGASQALNRKFGARLLGTYRNWYGTGEDYRFYVLDLSK